jgi:coenzyme F420 hydrogenase subunit beta
LNATPERKHWKHLYQEIVATEICCGCSACVVACPHHVLELRDFDPIQSDPNSPFDNCIHGEEGCSLCAMACLRLNPLLDVIEPQVFGARRSEDQPEGPYRFKTLARAADEAIRARGQDGGAVTALLVHGLDAGDLDGAVVAAPSPDVAWLDAPKLVRSSSELLATAGSRYTYCATPLGLRDAVAARCRKVAVVGVSCESTALRELAAEGIRRWTRPIALSIGLMCCETFDYDAFMIGVVENELGIPLTDITKVNVKGRVIVTLENGDEVTIPLKRARPYANEWCHHCPDFAAEHADLSCGGLGMEGWTMILVRSARGEEYFRRAVDSGALELRPAEERPEALAVMDRLAVKQRERVGPFEPHAAARWPTLQALAAARAADAGG